MALDTSILTNAWAHIRANPKMSQTDQEAYLAAAMKSFVEGADVLYVTGTLNSPSGTVTGSPTTPIATLK